MSFRVRLRLGFGFRFGIGNLVGGAVGIVGSALARRLCNVGDVQKLMLEDKGR